MEEYDNFLDEEPSYRSLYLMGTKLSNKENIIFDYPDIWK